MNNKKIVFLGLLFVLLSCKNDDITSKLAGSYIPDGHEINSVQLFTKSGEIKDTATINSFVRRQDIYHYFMLNKNSVYYNGIGFGVQFLSTHEAIFNYSFLEDKSYNVNVITNNNLIYLELKDTIRLFPKQPQELGKYMSDRMKRYKPLYADTLYNEIRYCPCYYITESEGFLKFPRFSYIYIGHLGNEQGMFINNAFNEESLSTLVDEDTLAVQQLQLRFIKKK